MEAKATDIEVKLPSSVKVPNDVIARQVAMGTDDEVADFLTHLFLEIEKASEDNYGLYIEIAQIAKNITNENVKNAIAALDRAIRKNVRGV